MAQQEPCPRMLEDGRTSHRDMSDWPDDGTCHYCGSLLGDLFMARLEAGDVELGPTDKSYKVYVTNAGGSPFQQARRVDSGIEQAKWKIELKEQSMSKFYFQHLTEDQQNRFVELLNAKKLKLGYPGYFYKLPFFCCIVPKDKS